MKKITLKDLHEINNKYPDKKDIHQSYGYDTKKNEWVFKGYKCSKCNRLFKRPGFIDDHELKCEPDRKLVDKQVKIEAEIRRLDGGIWTPLDINQIHSLGKTK